MPGADVIHGAEFARHLPSQNSLHVSTLHLSWEPYHWCPSSAEMGTLYPHVSNYTNLVPRKERKDGVGKGSCAL